VTYVVQSKAATVEDYLTELTSDRREAIAAVRTAIRENLPDGYEEAMQFGMIAYSVPLARYRNTYNGAPLIYAGLASQKRHMALYLTCVYADEGRAARFREAFRAAGKRLDIGKSCLRFRSLDELPLQLVADEIAATPVEDFIAIYEDSRRRGS
jgi:hypothetical protein